MRLLTLTLSVLALAAAPAHGQELRTALADLFRFGDCAEPLCLPVAAGEHGNHYVPSVVQGQDNLVGFLTSSIGGSVANLPISAASGGATFTFEGGRPVRQEISGGPIFAERARTIGRGRVFMGANISGFHYRSLRGVPLDALILNFTHENVGGAELGDPLFENDVIQVRADLDINLLVTTFVASYGLHDRMDVGVAVPLVRASLNGHSVAQVIPFGEGSPHVFGTTDDPRRTAVANAFGSAFGVGDVSARIKARLIEASGPRGADVAIVGEVRLPTGDEDELLGAGDIAIRALGIVSARLGDFSPHANVGFLSRQADGQTDAVLTTIGFDQLMSPWATLAIDVLSRWQVGTSDQQLPAPVTITYPFTRTILPTNLPDRRDNSIAASLGFRLTTSEGITVITNALMPLRRTGGLETGVAWTAGLEYSF